ncbi:hypothetical protein [uncultured Thiodictyon sp.]|uniref:hypothetical protein n=1 Tax=uncultured Thiodictyon sp. TaxID=1846217 RepID=UPI0025F4A4B7|nr:hypothetical protein [uncultured Thiodictyon sp.]
MSYYLKRYNRALRVNKKWALLALLAPGLYLIFAVFNDVTFKVSRDFAPYSGASPVAALDRPAVTLKLEDLVANPELLFFDQLAFPQLHWKLRLLENTGALKSDAALRTLTQSAMTLGDAGDARLRLSYSGNDPQIGSALVAFYSDRLLKRINDGIIRTQPRTAPGPLTFRGVDRMTVGDIQVVEVRSIWRAERLRPTLLALLLSSLGVLVLIAVLELADPSFKSERQMARYLGVPVLGGLPDAGPLVRRLPE